MHGLPPFADDEGDEGQGSHGVGPWLVPNRVDRQTRQSNPRHIAAEEDSAASAFRAALDVTVAKWRF